MRPDLIIEVAVPIESLLCVTSRFVRVEIALLIREAPPDLVDGAAGIGFFQDQHDLSLGELRLALGNLLARGGYSARTFVL